MIALPLEQALGPLNAVEMIHASKQLFIQGNPQLLKERSRVSIIGSRAASPEGLSRTRSLAKALVKRDVIVVSGLALGIDTAAHRSTMDSGGQTIAVIGTPLGQYYPQENQELQDFIAREHALVSQFQCPGGRGNFPMRNRTMALISDATVIVEAQNKSGSLYQGWEALRLGRPLYLMESLVNNPGLTWPQEMLSYGARILSRDGIDELCRSLPWGSRDELAELTFQ